MGAMQQAMVGMDGDAGAPPPPPPPFDITWNNLVNETLVTGNEILSTAGGYAGGGSSLEALPSSTEGYVEVIAHATVPRLERLFGIGTSSSGGGAARMNFAIDLYDNGAAWYIFESGSIVGGSRGTYANSDVFRITRFADGHVEYAQNGSLIYTSLVSSTATMYANGGAQSTSSQLMESITLSGAFA